MTEPEAVRMTQGGKPPPVLIARASERAAGLQAMLRERGIDSVAAPVIERLPTENPAELDAARERLLRNVYTWVAVTSVNAVDALLSPNTPVANPISPAEMPSLAQWAAVGPATCRALQEQGVNVDLVPQTATAEGLAAAFPAVVDGQQRVLLPLGNLASHTLRMGLEAQGWAVDIVTAYRTVAREIAPALRRHYDVVVIASGSAAHQVATQLGQQKVVTIGEPSARVAEEVGHTVLTVANSPTDAALAEAVVEALAII